MKRNSSGFIWGIILIVVGLLIAGRAFDLFEFTIFFDGWWTLFIIIPCFIGLFSNDKGRMSNLIGLCIGVLLLLSAQDVIRWGMFGPLCFAIVLVSAGINIMFKKEGNYSDGNYTNNQQNSNDWNANGSKEYTQYQSGKQTSGSEDSDTSENGENRNSYSNSNSSSNSHNNYSNSNSYSNNYNNTNARTGQCVCTAVLSGKDIRFDNQEFRGAVLSAVLGGIEIDLRHAIVRENVVIEAKAILGGIDIFVPSNVRVSINCTPILGGLDDHTISPLNADASTPTIFINATCVLGGIDVK